MSHLHALVRYAPVDRWILLRNLNDELWPTTPGTFPHGTDECTGGLFSSQTRSALPLRDAPVMVTASM
jgi:hypothetical protein